MILAIIAAIVVALVEFTVDATFVQIIGGIIIPIATGLITKYTASATLKQIVTLAFAGVTTALADGALANGGALITDDIVTSTAITFVIAVASYLGLYKPHDLNAKLAPDSGLGR